MTAPDHSRHNQAQPNHWFVLAAILAGIKLILYVLDSNPQVFLGDSMSYIVTARFKWIPHDRSFVYGFLLDYLTARSRSLSSLVAVQTVAGTATSMLTAVIITRFFRTSFKAATIAAVAVAIEPQQLLYERFVLTESLSTFVFVLYLFLAFEYLRTRRIGFLAAMQIAGLVLVGFRVSFVPMLLTATILAPAFAPDWRKRAVHGLVSIGLFLGLHSAYKAWNGWLMERPSAYTYADGFFLIANVSPLVSAADTDRPELAPVLARPPLYALEHARHNTRNAEMFDEKGLVARIREALKDEYRANIEAKRIAYRVIMRDPVGVARLAIQTHLKFYDRDYMIGVLKGEAGMRDLTADELTLLAHYHLDANGLPFMKTLTREYYYGVWPYYILLANTPLIVLAAWARTRRDAWMPMSFLLVVVTVHVVVVQALGVEPSPRHLHAAAIPLVLAITLIVMSFSLKRSGSRSAR